MASPPFSVNQTAPQDDDIVSQFPAQNRVNMDNLNDALESIMDFTLGKLKVEHVASPSTSSYPNGGLVWDTDASKLKIRLSGGFTSIGPEFPSGTRMVFQQTSAPAGWTKVSDSAYNNAVMLLTTGTVATAGTIAADEFLLTNDYFENNTFIGFGEFTTDSGGAHTHTTAVRIGNADGSGTIASENNGDANANLISSSDGSHTHTGDVTVNVFGDETPMFGGGANGVKIVEFIVAQKD